MIPAAPRLSGNAGTQIADTYRTTISTANHSWSISITNSMNAVTSP